MRFRMHAAMSVAALFATVAHAHEVAPAPSTSPSGAAVPVQAQSAPAASGLMMFIDPVTRLPRQPDAAEIEALARQMPSRPTGPMVQVAGPPGFGVSILLDHSFDTFMVGSRAADQSFAMECVTGATKAAETMISGVRPARAPQPRQTPVVLDVI